MSIVTPLLISGLDGNYLDITVPSPLTLLVSSFDSPDPSANAGPLTPSNSFPDVDAHSPLARFIASWDPHYVELGVPTSPEKVLRGRVCSRTVDISGSAPCSPRVQDGSFERKVSDSSISALRNAARTASNGSSVSEGSATSSGGGSLTSCSFNPSVRTDVESSLKTPKGSLRSAKPGRSVRNSAFSRFWKAVTRRTRI